MNWKTYRKPLTIVGALVALVGLGVWASLAWRGCSSPPVDRQDAGPSRSGPVGPARPEQPAREQPGPGEISLAGGVYDASGAPVAGAEISARFELGPGVDSLDSRALAAEPGQEAGQEAGAEAGGDAGVEAGSEPGFETMPAVVTTSAEDGSFTLRGLVPGRYRLRIEGPDIFASEVRFFDVPADGVRLIVARNVSVMGQVLGGAGQPVAGVRVGLESEAQGQVFTTSDEHGRFSFTDLQEGVFRVFAGHGELVARAQHVPRLGPGPFSDVTLTLEPGAVVTGRVVDRASGRGLAALVTLTATDSDEPARYAASGPDGVFRVEGVPIARFSAEAVAPGYVATEAIDFSTGGAFSPVIELSPGAALAGRVLDPRGSPVAGAVISVRGVDAGGAWQVLSEQALALRLARARGAAPRPGQEWGVDNAASEDGQDDRPAGSRDPRFVPRGELGVMLGPIPYPPPRGAAALRIARALTDESGQAADAPALPVHPDAESRFVTDEQGRFRITGLAAGAYRLVATHSEYADGISERLSLGLGQARAGIELTLYPGVLLAGQVTNTRGEEVVGATIIATVVAQRSGKGKPRARGADASDRRALEPAGYHVDADERFAESLRLQAVTGVDGRYTLGPIASDVALRVTAVRHGDVERAVDIGDLDAAGQLGVTPEQRTEDFVLPVADAVLSGRVRDSSGFPVRQADITVERMATRKPKKAAGWSDKWPEKWVRTSASDDDGRFEIPELAPGRYRVTVVHPGFPAFTTELATQDGVDGGPTEIALPFGGGIEAEIRDAHTRTPLAGARVLALGPRDAHAETAAAEDGGVELVPLVAGAWNLSVSAPGYVSASRAVEVPAGNEPRALTVRDLRVELERGATIAGTVRDHQGVRVRGARVRVGEVEVTTDEQGGFRMRDVPTGAVEIRAHKGAATGTLSLGLGPGDELVTLEVQLEAPATDPDQDRGDDEDEPED